MASSKPSPSEPTPVTIDTTSPVSKKDHVKVVLDNEKFLTMEDRAARRKALVRPGSAVLVVRNFA